MTLDAVVQTSEDRASVRKNNFRRYLDIANQGMLIPGGLPAREAWLGRKCAAEFDIEELATNSSDALAIEAGFMSAPSYFKRAVDEALCNKMSEVDEAYFDQLLQKASQKTLASRPRVRALIKERKPGFFEHDNMNRVLRQGNFSLMVQECYLEATKEEQLAIDGILCQYLIATYDVSDLITKTSIEIAQEMGLTKVPCYLTKAVDRVASDLLRDVDDATLNEALKGINNRSLSYYPNLNALIEERSPAKDRILKQGDVGLLTNTLYANSSAQEKRAFDVFVRQYLTAAFDASQLTQKSSVDLAREVGLTGVPAYFNRAVDDVASDYLTAVDDATFNQLVQGINRHSLVSRPKLKAIVDDASSTYVR